MYHKLNNMEVIELGLGDLDPVPITLDFKDDAPMSIPTTSVDFGGGIEMFMNDEQRSGSKQVNVDFADLDKLESQLNQLSGSSSSSKSGGMGGLFGDTTKSIGGLASNLFGFGSGKNGAEAAKSAGATDGYEHTDSKLGQSTTSSLGNTKTWDGFTKVSDIPSNGKTSSTNNLSDREKRRKKREMIKKLQEWYESGQVKQQPSHFTMDSAYEEVEDEYEAALEDKRKKDSVKLQGWWFITLVNSLEYANSAFDPFGVSLDGWGEKVSEDLPEYEEIFSELHDKYKGGKLAPEVSLLMRLGFSAAVVGFSNKALSSAAPAFGDVIRQSPELMRSFNDATVKALSQQSPGFAFASNLMKPSPDDVNTNFGPPPKPIETKSQPPPVRPGAMQFTQEPGRNYNSSTGPSNRPDLAMSRGAMFRESGVDLGNGYSDIGSKRPEMRGPQTDVDDILSGLKMKTVNIHEQSSSSGVRIEDESMVSISSLRDMTNMEVPKKSNRRKNRSDKNTISLGDL